MKVLMLKILPGHWRASGGWAPAYTSAVVDGFRVSCAGNGKGWACECPDPDCTHPDAVADLLHPSVLRILEADDDTEFRPPKPVVRQPKALTTPRRRRVEPAA